MRAFRCVLLCFVAIALLGVDAQRAKAKAQATVAPTAAPTAGETPAPTPAPTPSEGETPAPTPEPTPAPTAAPTSAPTPTENGEDDSPPMMVGGDRDANGCIGSAGYTWCAPKGSCIRPWEEPCDDITANATPAPATNTPSTTSTSTSTVSTVSSVTFGQQLNAVQLCELAKIQYPSSYYANFNCSNQTTTAFGPAPVGAVGGRVGLTQSVGVAPATGFGLPMGQPFTGSMSPVAGRVGVVGTSGIVNSGFIGNNVVWDGVAPLRYGNVIGSAPVAFNPYVSSGVAVGRVGSVGVVGAVPVPAFSGRTIVPGGFTTGYPVTNVVGTTFNTGYPVSNVIGGRTVSSLGGSYMVPSVAAGVVPSRVISGPGGVISGAPTIFSGGVYTTPATSVQYNGPVTTSVLPLGSLGRVGGVTSSSTTTTTTTTSGGRVGATIVGTLPFSRSANTTVTTTTGRVGTTSGTIPSATGRVGTTTTSPLPATGRVGTGAPLTGRAGTTIPSTGAPLTGRVGTTSTLPAAGRVGTTVGAGAASTGRVGTTTPSTGAPLTGRVGTTVGAGAALTTGRVGTTVGAGAALTGRVGTTSTVPAAGRVGTSTSTIPATGRVGTTISGTPAPIRSGFRL